MRKVINNLLYDTAKSTLVYKESDTKKQLWQVNSTQSFFFTYADGKIEPITKEAAKEYLGLVDVQVYIQMFGEPQEG
jgi:hypothetical protein